MFFNTTQDIPPLDVFDQATLTEVQDMAKVGMSKEEILDTYSITAEDWEAMPKTDRIYFEQFYSYGRGMGVRQVGEYLFQQASSKNGMQASLAYLKRFAKNFEGDVQGENGNFSLNMFMGEKDA